MTKKILIINSDLASNRGDRAIAEGVIQLINNKFPDSKITAISEHADRDSTWFGINFLPQNVHSLSPIDLVKLLREAKRSDLVFWGGGELLKDYTNKASLWYWVLKISSVRLFNKNLYGMYQGIGPTKSKSSKRLIRYVTKLCKKFAVRDSVSLEKLTEWGCDPNKLIDGVDPSILPRSSEISLSLSNKLLALKINKEVINKFVVIAPRDWFHYSQGGVIPYKYKGAFKTFSKSKSKPSDKKHDQYIKNLINLCDQVVEKGYNVILLPMHMNEEDKTLCNLLKSSAGQTEKVHTLNNDGFSPSEIRSIVSKAQAVIGLRLHSTIIATSSSVPSIAYYYVDKGRAYFEQIEQQSFAFSIESLLEKNFSENFKTTFDTLIQNKDKVKAELSKTNQVLKKRLINSFATMVESDD